MTKKEKPGAAPAPRPASKPDQDDSGLFRWYQDLMDRILPREREKEGPPPK